MFYPIFFCRSAPPSERLCANWLPQDAPLSAAAESATSATGGNGHGVSKGYASLDKRSGGGGSPVGDRGSGESEKIGRHAYAPLVEDGRFHHHGDGYSDGDAMIAGKEGGVIRLTSRHHVAIPISYFCIGFLGRWVIAGTSKT